MRILQHKCLPPLETDFLPHMEKDEKHYYEIDFLISNGTKLCPIEVKSSGYKTHVSLDNFYEKYSKIVAQRYLIYTKDLQKDSNTLLLPFYMIPFI